MLLAIWVSFVVLILLGLSTFVYTRNQRSTVNRNFAALTAILGLWILANFIDTNYKSFSVAPFITHIDFFLGPWVSFLFWLFANAMLKQARNTDDKNTTPTGIFAIVAVLGSVLTLIPIGVQVTRVDGLATIKYGNLFALYAVIVAGLALFGLGSLIIALHTVKNSILRAQISAMLWGIGIAALVLIIPNLIIPLFTTQTTINHIAGNISYAGIVFFIGITSYAIIKHRLFDLRFIIARSIAYTMTLGLVAVVYGYASYYVTTLFAKAHSQLTVTSLNVILIIVAVSIYPQLKVQFDKLTNKLFYRDAYDPQVFLGQLNQALVSNIDLEKLLKSCADIIATNLKANYCVFGIRETGFKEVRTIGTVSKEYRKEDIELVRRMAPQLNTTVMVTDALPPEAEKMQQILIKNDVAILARLVPEFAQNKEGLGYIILGAKRSGNIYTAQDERMISIIANELVIAVQNALHFEEIQRFNVTLQQKVEDATRRLRASNSRLKVLDETKDDFISMASHQLRTPLTSVKGYLSLVLDGDAGPIKDQQRKLLTQAFISSQRMVYLIADLLNVSRLKTGKFIIEANAINLADIVQEEVDQLVETAQSRSLTLSYHKPAHFPLLMLDETKIRQVAMNFMDNAIYYTPAGGHINIEVIDTPKTIEFKCVDDGIGVPKDEQHHLFTKFYRAKNAQRARPDGTGLGLFMAQKVVVAQGGAVIFTSKEGQGSTFGFTFPKDKLLAPDPVPANTASVT